MSASRTETASPGGVGPHDLPAFDHHAAIRMQGYLFQLEHELDVLIRHVVVLEDQLALREQEQAERLGAADPAPRSRPDGAVRRKTRSASTGPVLFRIADARAKPRPAAQPAEPADTDRGG